MRVFILGGTGSIGAPVVRTLLKRGHDVVGLARSAASASKLAAAGALPIRGNIRQPQEWLGALPAVDAVIHIACEFGAPMQQIEWHLLEALLRYLADFSQETKFIYTGGCWLFGATGDAVATEATAFAPLPAFAWSLQHMHRLLESPAVVPVIIHPAMVYAQLGGVFSRFAQDAQQGRSIRIIGDARVRWPLVHSDDLAVLYALALERGVARESYIGSAIDGMPVGRIARAFASSCGSPDLGFEVVSPEAIAAELGDWARGYALDQQLSGAKARASLGWQPAHLDPESEIAAFSESAP